VRWLLLLFIVVPLAELYLLLLVGRLIGFWPTVALTLVTGVAGGALAKHEGLRVWREWRRALEQMTPPEAGVVDGVLVLIGGALLITPGVLTDALGLVLLLPWSRTAVAARIRREVDRRLGIMRVAQFGGGLGGPGPWSDGDAPPDGGSASPVIQTTGETVE